MVSLDTTDEEILTTVLRDGPLSVADLSSEVQVERSEIRERLTCLQDDGLVTGESERTVSLTVHGRRVLDAPGTGAVDDRIDTSPAVERELESFDLPPDEEDAVRSAYAFLEYWGDATESELKDAIYAEHPAGYESVDAWWEDCIRDRLASLPSISSPDDGRLWRYTGEPEMEHIRDGRHVAGPTAVGSVRHGIEHVADTEAERAAVRAAFEVVFERGTVSVTDLVDAVYSAHPAGYDTTERWWEDCIRSALATLPHVHTDSTGETVRYE